MRHKGDKCWSKEEVETLMVNFSKIPVYKIAERIKRPIQGIYKKAQLLGLKSNLPRFKKGQQSWIKGQHICTNSGRTHFKKGHSFWLGKKRPELGKIISARQKGKKLSEETRKRMSIARTGHITSAETRMKISKKLIGRKIVITDERNERISKALKLKWENKDYKQSMLINLAKNRCVRPTIPEKRFMEICEKLNLPFQYVGNGVCFIGELNPDFINRNDRIVIEIYGDYWHSPLLRPRMNPIQHPDVRKSMYSKQGWKYMHFWESEVLNQKNEQKILQRLNNLESSHN